MKKSLILTSLLAASVLFTACGSSGSDGDGGKKEDPVPGNKPDIKSPGEYSIVTGADKLKSFTITTGENVIHPSGNPAFEFKVVDGTVSAINKSTGDILMSATGAGSIKVTATRVADDGTVSNVTSDPYTINFTAAPATVVVKKPMGTGAANDSNSSVVRTYTKNASGLQNVTGPNGLIWGDNVVNAKPDIKSYLDAVDFCPSIAGAGFRLPSLDEMLDLIDYSKAPYSAATDQPMIGGAGDEFEHKDLINVWVEKKFGKSIFVSENAGTMAYNNDGSNVAVRCVKGAKSDNAHVIYSTLAGLSVDLSTGLEWAKPSPTPMKAVAGEEYCGITLGNGYRMPTINELRSVIESGTVAPTITGGNRELSSNTPYIDVNGTAGGAAGDANWMLTLKEDGTITIGAGNGAVSINCVKDRP